MANLQTEYEKMVKAIQAAETMSDAQKYEIMFGTSKVNYNDPWKEGSKARDS